MKKKLRKNQTRREDKRSKVRKLGVQSLEARKLMAADIGLADGFISIYGSDGPDNVNVELEGDQIVVSMTAPGCAVEQSRFAADEVQGLFFTGGAGDDVFLNETNLPAIVIGGAGRDIVMSGSGADVISGGDGDDVLISSSAIDIVFGGAGQNVMIPDAAPIVSEDPVSEDPVSEDPVSEDPVSEDPVSEDPVSEDPVSEDPVSEDPVSEDPVSEDPVSEDPVSSNEEEILVERIGQPGR